MHDPGDNLFVNGKRKRKRDTTVFTAQDVIQMCPTLTT
jgi:hypothetical protein